MTLAQYRRKFPNIDWSKPSPAAEFAMEPQDVDGVFAEMATGLAFAATRALGNAHTNMQAAMRALVGVNFAPGSIWWTRLERYGKQFDRAQRAVSK